MTVTPAHVALFTIDPANSQGGACQGGMGCLHNVQLRLLNGRRMNSNFMNGRDVYAIISALSPDQVQCVDNTIRDHLKKIVDLLGQRTNNVTYLLTRQFRSGF